MVDTIKLPVLQGVEKLEAEVVGRDARCRQIIVCNGRDRDDNLAVRASVRDMEASPDNMVNTQNRNL